MAIPRSKERNLKRLKNQLKKHENNPKMVTSLEKRIETLEKSKGY